MPSNGDPEAAKLFATGMRLIDQGDYEKAVVQLERVYALHPDPMVLYNLGVAYAALGKPALSADRLEKFLAMTPDDHSVLRERASAKLVDQNKRVGTLSLESETPDGWTLDGVPVENLPLRRRLAVGTHVVAFEHPGGSTPTVWRVELHGGESVRLVVARDATPPAPVAAKPAPSPDLQCKTPTPIAIDSNNGGNRRSWPAAARVTGVVAGVLALAAGGLFVWNTGRYFEWRRSRDSAAADAASSPSGSNQELDDVNRRLAGLQTTDKVVIGLAAAAAASAAATVILIWPRHDRGIALSPTAGGVAATVRWKF